MVVTRRQSVGPTPAVASRTSSSTGSSRSSKGKGVDKSSAPKEAGAGLSRHPPNGTSSRLPTVGPQVVDDISFDDDSEHPPPELTPPKVPSPKPKPKPKVKSRRSTKIRRHHANKGVGVFDILARLFLLWFTIYTLSVCPDDLQLRSPVCRALTMYRRVILEPYIYPPIRAALDHPSIAPHIQRAQPYYNRAVEVTLPLVHRGKNHWRTQIVPQVHRLQMGAQPYIHRVKHHYDATLGPHVQRAVTTVTQYKHKAQPYVYYAAVNAQRTWRDAQPYLLPLGHGAARIPELVTRFILKPLGDARRQWVDPQVAKILDAVVEKGKAETVNIRGESMVVSKSTTTVASSSPTGSTPSSIVSTPTSPLAGARVSALQPENDVGSSGNDTSVSSSNPEPTNEAVSAVTSVVVNTVSSISSTLNLSTSTGSADDVPQSKSERPTSIDQSTQDPKTTTSSRPSAPPNHSDPQSHSTVVVSQSFLTGEGHSSSEEVAEDLEEFLIGLNEPDEPVSHSAPQSHEETAAEEAERLRLEAIQTAEKRADIEARHDQWEIDLDTFGKAQRKVVRATLQNLREAAAEEARAPGAAVRVHVEALIQEAEKSLKSLKLYSHKLAGENKVDAEKIKTWELVVARVEKKFGSRVDAAVDAVREWWSAYLNKEVGEINAIATEVEELAHRAQADLGLDYAWLRDVTYDDWQRYHRLLDKSKQFGDIYLGMQNGTLPNAPPNPVADIMEALQVEVDDVILGFETNLSIVRNAAMDTLRSTDAESEPDTSTSTAESEHEVSILPIDPHTAENSGPDIPPIILSRGTEEIYAAASRAEEARTRAAREDL